MGLISPSIEWLHAKLDKQIQLTEAYTENKGLSYIITSCRLKPYSYIFEKIDNSLILHRWWFDEFGNSLHLTKKKISIIYNDLKLNRKKIICTDIYYGLTIPNVLKMSKILHLVAGKDEDLGEDCFLLSFLGIDNHLRSYLYLHEELEQVSPLLMGMEQLKLIYDQKDTKTFYDFELKEIPIPCQKAQVWVSCLPLDKSFLKEIEKYESVSQILEGV